jgi:hypothetical protein
MTRHPGLWVVEFTQVGLVLAIVWNMTQKPGTASAIAALVGGVALALRFMNAGAADVTAAVEPAA